MKRGFTLVEISIVLVIVGLLIGGILVGRSMTETVRVQRLVSDMQQYSIALINFNQTYHQEAGDSKFFAPAGNNDGQVNGTVSCVSPPSMYVEQLWVWSQLSQAQMLSANYVWDGVKYCNKDYAGVVPVYRANKIGLQPLEYYFSSTGTLMSTYPFFREFSSQFDASIVQALETKIDDGVISSTDGSIISYYQALSKTYFCFIFFSKTLEDPMTSR